MGKKYSYWIDSGKYSFLQKILVFVLGFLAFMLLARYFEPAQFGEWTLFILITSIVETARNALIRNGYIVFKHKEEGENQSYVEFAALITNISFSVVLILVFFFLGPLIQDGLRAPDLGNMLLYYCIGMLFLIPFSHTEIFLFSEMDFKGIFWMYLLRNGLFSLCTVLVFFKFFDISLEGLSLIYSLCILPAVALGLYLRNRYKRFLFKGNKVFIKRFLNYGKYVFGNNICSLIFVSTDSLMTSRFVSQVAVSYYNTGSRILNFADIPSQVLGDIMFPKAARIMKEGDDEGIKRIYEKTVAATLSFILPVVIFVLLFPKLIILIVAGSKYLDGVPILRLMIFYSIFLPFIKQFGNIMDVKGKPHVNFWLMLTFACINITMNYFFIGEFGMLGAVYGTLISYVLLFVTTQVVLFKVIKSSLFTIIKNVFLFYPEYIKIVGSYGKGIKVKNS